VYTSIAAIRVMVIVIIVHSVIIAIRIKLYNHRTIVVLIIPSWIICSLRVVVCSVAIVSITVKPECGRLWRLRFLPLLLTNTFWKGVIANSLNGLAG
jgi:hypothetical protein